MLERITANLGVCGGQACLKGTRIPVYVVLDFLSAGDTVDDILKEYPQLTREDIFAAIEYAALLTKEEISAVGAE